MTVTFMPSAPCESWRELEFLSTARRIGFPAAAPGAAPVELARLEAAGFAAIAREAPNVAVHEIAHQLQVSALVRRARRDHLRLEPAVQAEQGRIAAQLVAHQLVGLLVALRSERLLKDDVEQVERRIALEVAGEQPQALLGVAAFAVRFIKALRGERKVGRILRFDAFPVLDGALAAAAEPLEVAEEQARTHALTVRLERRLEMAAGAVRTRAGHLGGGELAVELRLPPCIGADLARERDGTRPILFLLVDLEQVSARRTGLRAILQLAEHL